MQKCAHLWNVQMSKNCRKRGQGRNGARKKACVGKYIGLFGKVGHNSRKANPISVRRRGVRNLAKIKATCVRKMDKRAPPSSEIWQRGFFREVVSEIPLHRHCQTDVEETVKIAARLNLRMHGTRERSAELRRGLS